MEPDESIEKWVEETNLCEYNAFGEREYQAVDMSQSGQIDFGGSDRITRTVREVLASSDGANPRNEDVIRTTVSVWPENGTTVGCSNLE